MYIRIDIIKIGCSLKRNNFLKIGSNDLNFLNVRKISLYIR